MLLSEEIEKRKPIWQAISDLWLDNEMQDFEIRHIVELMQKSEFSIEELNHIFTLKLFRWFIKIRIQQQENGLVLTLIGFMQKFSKISKNKREILYIDFG